MASKSDKKTQDMITNYKYACEWICKNQIEYHLFHFVTLILYTPELW